MSRLTDAFLSARAERRAALVPYLTAGWPDSERCLELLVGMADAGADVIELGVPFSDPVADGPTIQRASLRALEGGATLRRALELAAALRRERAVPLVLFTYLNPMLRFGTAAAAHALREAGGDGVLVCDLPVEEGAELREAFGGAGLDVVALVAPTSTPARVAAIARAASGFVYLIARTGVTGAGGGSDRLAEGVATIRHHTDLPVAVGFGVADATAARAAADVADGVVVGSAFLDAVEARGAAAGLRFLHELREALADRPAARLTSFSGAS